MAEDGAPTEPNSSEAQEAVRSFHKLQEDEDRRHRLLATCPVFRIMSGYAVDEAGNLKGYRRLDEMEIIRCRFGAPQVLLMDRYFQRYFASPLLSKLRLQVCLEPRETIEPNRTQLDVLTSVLRHHSRTLRTVDLSRNRLDGRALVEVLGERGLHAASSSALQVLDVSYNDQIGDDGASVVMESVEKNPYVRAVIMKGCNVGNDGAVAVSQYLRGRVAPQVFESGVALFDVNRGQKTFHINLNENRIGAPGSKAIGYGIPDFVSISLCGQHLRATDPNLPYRGKRGGKKRQRDSLNGSTQQ